MIRFVLTIAFSVAFAANASPIYKWVDDAGNVHYSDQPPADQIESEELTFDSGVEEDKSREYLDKLDFYKAKFQRQKERRLAAREKKAYQREVLQAEKDQRMRSCLKAQENLNNLKLALPVYYVDETGQRVFLDDTERAKEIEHYEGEVITHCDSLIGARE